MIKLKVRPWSVKTRKLHNIAKKHKRKSESYHIVGPIKLEGKKYYFVGYWSSSKYWTWFLKGFQRITISKFIPDSILNIPFITRLLSGIIIIDSTANVVQDRRKIDTISKIGLVFVEVYLNPPFKIGHKKIFELKLKFFKKIYEDCNNRVIPGSTNLAEEIYNNKLKEADEQVILQNKFYPKYLRKMMRSIDLFKQVSENPTDKNVDSLHSVLKEVSQLMVLNIDWLNNRALTWPEFMKAADYYKTSIQNKRYLDSIKEIVIIEVLIEVTGKLISIGGIIYSVFANIIIFFWSKLFGYVFGFTWQTSKLLRKTEQEKKYLNRLNLFLEIYDLSNKQQLIRNYK